MTTTDAPNYAALDVPEILQRLFHPRPEVTALTPPTVAQEVLIPVAAGVDIGGRFYTAGALEPTLLYFHGNGEIVADYEDLGPVYTERGLNFFPVDYRGYGRSTGSPTFSTMMRDCHAILAFVQEWLGQRGFSGPLVAMGRSLGSASVLELAAHHQDKLDGLIVESGFAYAGPLLEVLGVDLQTLGFTETVGFRNVDKIKLWHKPLLIIHAEWDHIIPLSDGQALYDACPSPKKTLLQVGEADHNNILAVGFEDYMEAVVELGSLAKRLKN